MDQSLVEIVLLAFVAGFVLFRLYTTLGKRTGAEPPAEPAPAPAQGELAREPLRPVVKAPLAQGEAASEGVSAIMRADPNFSVEHFLAGARGAYELIVGAFARGDREALRGLLTPRVFDAYCDAINQREQGGGQGPELVRLRTLELADASLDGSIARVVVRFESELAEGAHGVRDARERWTFEREVRSPDPNWRLARVSVA